MHAMTCKNLNAQSKKRKMYLATWNMTTHTTFVWEQLWIENIFTSLHVIADCCCVSLLQGTDWDRLRSITSTTTAPLQLPLLLHMAVCSPKWWKPSTLTGLSTLWEAALKDGISTVFLFIAVVADRTFLRNIFHTVRNISQISLHQAVGKWWLQHFHRMVCSAWMFVMIISNHKTSSAPELPTCLCLWVNVILVSLCGCLHLHGVNER